MELAGSLRHSPLNPSEIIKGFSPMPSEVHQPDAAVLEEAAKKVRETAIEIQSATFGSAMAYINVIILAGYAAIFGIWEYTREFLPEWITLVVATMTGLSLVMFVSFEVYKIRMLGRSSLALSSVLLRESDPIEFLQAIDVHKRQSQEQQLRFLPLWNATFIGCVVTGFGAAAVLLGAFFWRLYSLAF